MWGFRGLGGLRIRVWVFRVSEGFRAWGSEVQGLGQGFRV